MLDGILFKKSYERPLLQCLRSEEAEGILKEIHDCYCDNHLGGRALARKVTLADYF